MELPVQIKSAQLLRHKKNGQEKKQFLREILTARRELDTVTHNIDFTNDALLLEHYIFKRKACEMRYRYLINQAKQRGLIYNEYAQKLIAERYSR